MSQVHGNRFEDYIKKSFSIPEKYQTSYLAQFDIEKSFDKEYNLPTSIKVVKNIKNWYIGLASAPNFWNINEPYRLIIGLYNQIGDTKQFNQMFEFLLTQKEHQKLINPYTYEEILLFDKMLKSFPAGIEGQRQAILTYKSSTIYKENLSIIKLNPKVDSKNQRRLQCSITCNNLKNNIKICRLINDNDFYRNNNFNFSLESSSRKFNK